MVKMKNEIKVNPLFQRLIFGRVELYSYFSSVEKTCKVILVQYFNLYNYFSTIN